MTYLECLFFNCCHTFRYHDTLQPAFKEASAWNELETVWELYDSEQERVDEHIIIDHTTSLCHVEIFDSSSEEHAGVLPRYVVVVKVIVMLQSKHVIAYYNAR